MTAATNLGMRSTSRITRYAVSSLDFMYERSVYRDTPAGITNETAQMIARANVERMTCLLI